MQLLNPIKESNVMLLNVGFYSIIIFFLIVDTDQSSSNDQTKFKKIMFGLLERKETTLVGLCYSKKK